MMPDAFSVLRGSVVPENKRPNRFDLMIVAFCLVGSAGIAYGMYWWLPPVPNKQRAYTLTEIDSMRGAEKILRFSASDGSLKPLTLPQIAEIEEVMRTNMSANIEPAPLAEKAIAFKRQLIEAETLKQKTDLTQALEAGRDHLQ